MRCIVTGGAGFVGSHVVDTLINAGHEVTVIDNLTTGKLENLNPKATFWEADITVQDLFDEVGPVDYVFHLAALARIQPSIDNPLPSHDVNLTGTLSILEYVRNCGAKIIFSSSSSIYKDIPMLEIAPKHPKNPYSLQKWMCEEYIRLYGELYGMKYAILRYFNVYGERQILEGAYAAIIGIFLKQKSEGKPLTITNDGEQRRDFTYVEDVARANLMAMNWSGETNIGTGKNYSINELAQLVGGEEEYIGERRGEARETLADITKAKSLGWKPTVDIKDWIAHVRP